MLRAAGLAEVTPTSTTSSAAVMLMNATGGGRTTSRGGSMSARGGSKERQEGKHDQGSEQGQVLMYGRAMACAVRCLSSLRHKNPGTTAANDVTFIYLWCVGTMVLPCFISPLISSLEWHG